MTVICYDGEIFAADRKSRKKGEDGVKVVKSISKSKIATDFGSTCFDGEDVLAIGRAGRLKISMEMIECVRRSKDLAKTIDTLGAKLKRKFEGTDTALASLLIMTTNHIHLVKVSKKFEVTWTKENRSKKMAIGSGARIALFLMEHQGMSAVNAVVAMELHHPCCGGGATYTSRALLLSAEPIVVLKFAGRRTLVKHFLETTASSAKARLKQLPSY
jgi:hypothetical protein